jgi:hypothetical protein
VEGGVADAGLGVPGDDHAGRDEPAGIPRHMVQHREHPSQGDPLTDHHLLAGPLLDQARREGVVDAAFHRGADSVHVQPEDGEYIGVAGQQIGTDRHSGVAHPLEEEGQVAVVVLHEGDHFEVRVQPVVDVQQAPHPIQPGDGLPEARLDHAEARHAAGPAHPPGRPLVQCFQIPFTYPRPLPPLSPARVDAERVGERGGLRGA